MVKHAIPLATILILVILFSGCMGSGGKQCPVVVSQTEGVFILGITPSYYEVPVGADVSITMDLQNRGMTKAENVEVLLWSHGGFAFKDLPGNEELKYVGTLMPPNLDICSAGDVKILTWSFQAGCDPTATTIAVQLDYDYSSEGWREMFIVSQDEAEKTAGLFKEKGRNFPSAGPVHIEIETLQTEPIIITRGTRTFDARINFKNTGNGLVGDTRLGGELGKLGKVVLTVDGPCVFTASNDGIWDSKNPKKLTWNNLVQLSAGKQEILKVVHLSYPPGEPIGNLIKDYCTLKVDANYHYVNVEGTDKKIGVYGTSDQRAKCLAETEKPGETTLCKLHDEVDVTPSGAIRCNNHGIWNILAECDEVVSEEDSELAWIYYCKGDDPTQNKITYRSTTNGFISCIGYCD